MAKTTLSQIVQWAEKTMPGDEKRVGSVFADCRKKGCFTTGGRGNHAPIMKSSDFSMAVLAVLHHGKATESGEAVEKLAQLPLALLEIDDPSRVEPIALLAEDIDKNHFEADYSRKFGLELWHPNNVFIVLMALFEEYAPNSQFFPDDKISLEASGDRKSIKIQLRGGDSVDEDGWRGQGPDHSRITMTFGDFTVWESGPHLRQTRSLYGEAINSLAALREGDAS